MISITRSNKVKQRRLRKPLNPYCAWWRTRTFKTRKSMERFKAKYPDNQYQEIFVNNAYGVLYKRLRVIG